MREKRLHVLGHSHIDLAWRWTKDETYEVCYNTFKNVLKLMEKYPKFTFCQSSAQIYEWIETQHPELFRKIKERVKEGRWEIVGGTWVEFDSHIPSGESLVRQFLYGKRYFKEKFGVDVKICWLPDTFGFCWTLPQIMVKSGVKYFLTQKLRWNDMTRFIWNIFWWMGQGGFKVLAYQTLGGYNEKLTDISAFEEQFRTLWNRHEVSDLLILFGRGDHGGGPTEEDLESAFKWRKLNRSPKIEFTTALKYFQMLENMPEEKFPIVNDELYLQYHRGCYTTQAKIKLQNRKAEIMLEIAEKLASLAMQYGFNYPKEKLEEAWKKTLFNQFHDIICGSSIEEVYEESDRDYKVVFEITERIIREAMKKIASQINTLGRGKPLVVFNTLSWNRDGIVEVNIEGDSGVDLKVEDADGNPVPSQIISDGKTEKLIFLGRGLPSIGYKTYRIVKKEREENAETDLRIIEDERKITLENSKIKAQIDRKTGLITSLYDKVNKRETLDSKGITIQIFEDYPVEGRKTLDNRFEAVNNDAWEIYIFQQPGGVKYTELKKPEEIKIVDKGPVKATVEVKYKYLQKGRPDSIFKVQVILYSEMPMLFLNLEIDWHTVHRLAKIAFPLNLRSEYATYEIPYGFIKRRNPLSPEATLSERAKWEVPGQKWIDYTDEEANYGVSILNDCKYGFDHANNVLRVTLLRSPRYPFSRKEAQLARAEGKDPRKLKKKPTDQGVHEIRLAVYPHRGDWREASTVRKAYEFNYPLLTQYEKIHNGSLPKSHSFMKVKPENVIISAIKKAEDSEDLILRLYETASKRTKVEISFDKELKKAAETDLIEREIRQLKTGKSLVTSLDSNEIKTLKVQL